MNSKIFLRAIALIIPPEPAEPDKIKVEFARVYHSEIGLLVQPGAIRFGPIVFDRGH
jgi:hypothetical protein